MANRTFHKKPCLYKKMNQILRRTGICLYQSFHGEQLSESWNKGLHWAQTIVSFKQTLQTSSYRNLKYCIHKMQNKHILIFLFIYLFYLKSTSKANLDIIFLLVVWHRHECTSARECNSTAFPPALSSWLKAFLTWISMSSLKCRRVQFSSERSVCNGYSVTNFRPR